MNRQPHAHEDPTRYWMATPAPRQFQLRILADALTFVVTGAVILALLFLLAWDGWAA